MADIGQVVDSQLTVHVMNRIFPVLVAETVSSTHALIGASFKAPEWFCVLDGETLAQLTARGLDAQRYRRHLEQLLEKGDEGIYGNGIAGVRFSQVLTKYGLVSVLDTIFEEYLHHVQSLFWRERDRQLHWFGGGNWALEAIAKKTQFNHLPNLYQDEFLRTAGLERKDFLEYVDTRINSASPEGLAGLLFIHLVDAIANPEYVYGKGRDLFLDALKDQNFNPIKSRFNAAVGSIRDSVRINMDAFRYFVNAPIPEIALYFLIEQKKGAVFNGRTMAQMVKEAYSKGYAAKNVELSGGGTKVVANEMISEWLDILR